MIKWLRIRRLRRELRVLWACAALERARGIELVLMLGQYGLYATVEKLERDGMLVVERRDRPGPRREGRPPYRFYVVTEEGRRYTGHLVRLLSSPQAQDDR